MALLDPRLTLGLPARITAATGIDGLVHGIESLASRGANPVSVAYATQAVAMVGRWLSVAHPRAELGIKQPCANSASARTCCPRSPPVPWRTP
ncbi:iron-containing alcohol dehydrogenase [Streptomyces chartreusis]|uniref:iron-containing alcohol dehydrogenase n=1 Tax=Streptomyces chartreusis TaxID=1969 RepID=UPI003626177A